MHLGAGPPTTYPPAYDPPLQFAFAVVEPGEAELKELLSRLGAYNRTRADWNRRIVAVTLRDADGTLVGGGWAQVLLGLAEIRGVWVRENLRGRDLGTEVMRRLEAAARERGATRAMLFTYSFQAGPFFERLGYAWLATLPRSQGNAERHDLTEELGEG